MSAGFPCPNPTCTHSFSAEEIAAADALPCPRCGNVFQIRVGGGAPASGGATAKATTPGASSSARKAVPGVTSSSGRKSVPGVTSAAGKSAVPAPMSTASKSRAVPPSVPPKSVPARPAVPPAAVRPAPAPVPQPVAHAEPAPLSFTDDAPTELPEPVSTGPVLSMPRSLRKKPANWYKRIGIATLVLAVIGGLVWVAMYSIKMGGNLVMGVRLDGGPSGPPAHSSTQYNYKFIFPDAPWVLDDPTKFDFRANLGFRRTNPTAFMALIANDFKSRTPRTAELIGRGLRFLNDYFEDIDRGEPAEINFGGQPAQLLAFQGAVRKTNARMAGECVMLSYRGVGYWMACWADEGTFPTVRKDFEMLRTKFVLLQERRDWQEKRPKAVDYPGSKADYALRDTEAMWKPEEKPESFDELADQAFVAHEKDDPGRIIDKEDRSDDPKKDLSRNSATVQVLVMNEAKSVDAATDAALAYIEEKQKKLSPDATVSKPLTDTRDPLGGVPARQVTLRVTIKEGTERYFQVAVVPRPMGVVVIVGECDWKASAKGKWVSDFTQFIKSFRAEKGKAAKGGG